MAEKVGSIKLLLIKFSGGTPVTELISGNVDVAHILARDIRVVAEDPCFDLYYGYDSIRTQIFWNHNHQLFRHPSVRQALTLAIDRRTLHKVLNFPENLPITDGLYTSG